MSSKYKLLYFNVTGLAEPIRYILAFGNVKFEDYRFEYDEWLKLKPTTPFGQVPILEINDKPIPQSVSICRYLAKKFNLTGKNDLDALEADIIVDTLTDFRLHYRSYFQEQNELEKLNKYNDIKKIHNPFYLPRFEDLVKTNGGHFVNNQLTWADLYFSSITELLTNIIKEPILTDYPSLSSLKEKVDSIPSIKSYRDKRPETVL